MTAAVNLEPVGLKSLPVFSRGHADCSKCELQKQCDKGAMAHAYRPDVFNGIMIVGEGPGGNEVAQNEPFVGRSGQLLRALLETAGIDREQCYITNATLCQPPAGEKKDKGLHDSFPHAIYSCLPRLEAEIEAVRPRVIIALGGAALIALTGYEEIKSKRIPFECPTCDPKTRRLGPVIQCTAKMHDKTPCGWYMHLPTAEELEAKRPEKCPRCTAKLKNQKVKQIKCPSCHGLKTKEQQVSSFTYDYKISEVAGAVFRAEKTDARWDAFGVKYIIPTYHPSFAMRKGEGKGMFGQYVAEPMIKHFQKAHRLLTNEPTWDMRYRVTKDPKVLYEYVAGQKFNFAVDIETEAWGLDEDAEEDIDKLVQLDARKKWKVTAIKCVGIGALELGEMLVVDTRDASDELIDVLADFLEDEAVPKTFQNGPYDTVVIRRLWGIHTKNYADDTLLSHHALYPDEKHDLAHLAFSFTDAEAWKPPKKIKGAEKHESFEDLCLYNARDVYNTLLAREGMGVSGGKAIVGGLVHREKTDKAYEIDMVMQRIAIDMTLVGMPVDKEALNRIGVEAQLKADKALYQMRAFLNDPQFNPASTRQLGFVLFDQMGPLRLIPTAYTETGQASTAADELAKLSSEPFVQSLLAYRAADKTVSTYVTGEAWEVGIDGRIHPEWKVQGTRTGRWSSASPNFQNIPKWIRSCVVAPPGRSFVGADYAQLELRIMAALSGDVELIKRCRDAVEERKLEPDFDPHSYVASLAFGTAFTAKLLKDPAHVKTQAGEDPCKCETCTRKALRDVAKRVVYGLNYGAGAATVLGAIYSGGYSGPPITLQMVERTKNVFFRAFPGVPKWRDKMLKEAAVSREIRSPLLNRRRIFPLGDIDVTVVYNYPIQSGAADIMNQRLEILAGKLSSVDPSARLIAQVHDAIYVECDEKLAEAVATLVQDSLSWTVALAEGALEMPFLATAAIAKNWKDAA